MNADKQLVGNVGKVSYLKIPLSQIKMCGRKKQQHLHYYRLWKHHIVENLNTEWAVSVQYSSTQLASLWLHCKRSSHFCLHVWVRPHKQTHTNTQFTRDRKNLQLAWNFLRRNNALESNIPFLKQGPLNCGPPDAAELITLPYPWLLAIPVGPTTPGG